MAWKKYRSKEQAFTLEANSPIQQNIQMHILSNKKTGEIQ